MKHIKYIGIFLLVICSSTSVMAQKSERDHIRRGNKLYNDSLFVKAEVEYRKALDANPKSTEALYNLGNALLMQQKAQEAMKQYETASKIETNKTKLAKIYHNAGVILQSGKQYPQCIEAYKQSLRNNPADNETRYNLALAQKMLKDHLLFFLLVFFLFFFGFVFFLDKQKQQEQKQDKQNQDQKQQENKNQQQQENKDQMSKENAEQLLNAVMQDEKNVQEKVKKNLQMRGKKYDKDW